ncbi:MAG: ABC transporter ATP-binding protein [Armatimonadetes bacterium]|nr:ABC transporter ATP-binding protein [Armatimonadota bacterium]
MLSIRDLHVYYGAIHALKGVTIDVSPGEVVTLIGANGAGKSTLLRTISGLLRPRRGSILFEDRPLHHETAHRIVARGICQVPEGRRIFANMTVHENLELGAFLRKDREGTQQDLERCFELFPRLKERLRQNAGTLSGGEQQMLAMARGLMGRPRVLLLDEPSMGLAPLLVAEIFKVIREINQTGTTILLVEQNAAMALSVAHRGSVLETGRIVLSGPAAELAQNQDVKKAYLGL